MGADLYGLEGAPGVTTDQYQGAESVLAGLKDFQLRTSQYTFQRLFTDPEPTARFLVADEVGLGKTLVARGLIAQAIDHLRAEGDERIDIIYICSNGAIARQNVRRIDVTREGTLDDPGVDRLTMLPTQLGKLGTRGINLIPITPGTSFDLGRNLGRFEERALLFSLLESAWGSERLSGSGPARLFYTGISDENPAQARHRLRGAGRRYAAQVPGSFKHSFRKAIVAHNAQLRENGKPILQQEFDSLVPEYRYPKNLAWPIKQRRGLFIGALRQLVAELAVEQLQPDIVILDEFQRFKQLLNHDDDTFENRIARKLFSGTSDTGKATRVVLLSATPYKMYTQQDDPDGDDHHEDLIHTLRFLFDNEDEAEGVRETLRRLYRSLIDGQTGVDQVRRSSAELSDKLRRVMARTERVTADEKHDAMIEPHTSDVLTLENADVKAFLASNSVANELGVASPVELWKSGTYLLNFLEGYALRRTLDEKLEQQEDTPAFREAIAAGHGLLPWEDIEAYEPLDPGNARLRALIRDTVDQELWRLLWLPPSLPYYRTGSEFDRAHAEGLTKRLVFSGWRLVPKVIAAITSYEAERRMTELGDGDVTYTKEFNLRSGRLLDFRLDEGRPAAMTSLAFVYPSPALAALGDIRSLLAGNATPSVEEVRTSVRSRIENALAEHLQAAPTDGEIDHRWIWAAPLLLDHQQGKADWIHRASSLEAWTGKAVREGGLKDHVEWARVWLNDRTLGRPPDDLLEALTDLAIGSPANAALRALVPVTGGSLEDHVLRDAAAHIAWGFRALFNGPAETALIRSRSKQPYWRAALEYCVDGNLQAVLDEYLHVLREWMGAVSKPKEQIAAILQDAAYSALTLRTTRYFADIPTIDENSDIAFDRHALRGRFAVQYGDHKDSAAGDVRASHVSEAFNSPFWPFVLATTSIGQEGLDFHLYCHAVVHWNLPHNPVDLEQREGRVHRFKGHAVRKNIAAEYGTAAMNGKDADTWSRMFELAQESATSDLIPFWMFRSEKGRAAIERYVPMLPLSREQVRYPGLLKSVATYRLAFGQPRQDELVDHLLKHHSPTVIAELLNALRVDLTPPMR